MLFTALAERDAEHAAALALRDAEHLKALAAFKEQQEHLQAAVGGQQDPVSDLLRKETGGALSSTPLGVPSKGLVSRWPPFAASPSSSLSSPLSLSSSASPSLSSIASSSPVSPMVFKPSSRLGPAILMAAKSNTEVSIQPKLMGMNVWDFFDSSDNDYACLLQVCAETIQIRARAFLAKKQVRSLRLLQNTHNKVNADSKKEQVTPSKDRSLVLSLSASALYAPSSPNRSSGRSDYSTTHLQANVASASQHAVNDFMVSLHSRNPETTATSSGSTSTIVAFTVQPPDCQDAASSATALMVDTSISEDQTDPFHPSASTNWISPSKWTLMLEAAMLNLPAPEGKGNLPMLGEK
jgi:hypothetical protein